LGACARLCSSPVPFDADGAAWAGDGAGFALAAFAVEQAFDQGVALALLRLLGELVLGSLGLLLVLSTLLVLRGLLRVLGLGLR